ncbi:hypothetical protein CLV59_104141 [Chitinophaga dinghuensis]|uniref:Uncharacterized protein n=1 Tax=Chitinophaga dinghuensis TaxID=1539050 RepID=A0A327W0Z9_9BACT|nr:hypothetical protein [Chitinophaga dinghuensis]RAJ81916.1 hypothetical protein CLV59_104141 [Chitinophaga dinghuensis]
MGRFFLYFWLVFIAYFVFVHPAIIYYNTNYGEDVSGRSEVSVMICLALSVLMWGAAFLVSLWYIYKYTFQARKNLNRLATNGTPLKAKIMSVKPLKGPNEKELKLAVKNLQGEEVTYKMGINDSRPYENRFETGKHLTLRIDPAFRGFPYVVVEGSFGHVNYRLYAVWLLFLSGVAYYFYFAYQTESKGDGWRFLVFSHPLIISALVLLSFGLIFYLVVVKIIWKLLFKGTDGKDALKLKFLGAKTIAKIVRIAQTGVYINEQPEVKYDISFQDKRGTTHQASVKKIIQLIDIGDAKPTEKEIFYLPEDPSLVGFSEDINDHE